MARPTVTIHPRDFTPSDFKGVAGHVRRWAVNHQGIIRSDWHQPKRIVWGPARDHASKAWDKYGETIMTIAEIWDLDPRVLVATICCESAVQEQAERHEPHIADWSFGLCQILTGTAYHIGTQIGWPSARDLVGLDLDLTVGLPARKGPLSAWRAFLNNPWNNIALCAAIHNANSAAWVCHHDPILMYTAYNSGGLYVGSNAFGMHATKSAVEAFELFFNEASAIINP